MIIFAKFLSSIGLKKITNFPEPYSYNILNYNPNDSSTNESKIAAHKEFLKTAIDEENNRLSFIENKTSQLISQTSIIFSLLSLFIPLIIEKSNDTSLLSRIFLILLILFAFLFYSLAISNALKNFNIHEFKYSVASAENVINFKDKSKVEFEVELIRDYLYCINKNIVINNKKATNLLHSYNSFKIANFITVIIVVVISIMILFFNSSDPVIKINEPIKVDKFEELLKKEIKAVIKVDTVFRRDTIYIKSK